MSEKKDGNPYLEEITGIAHNRRLDYLYMSMAFVMFVTICLIVLRLVWWATS